MFIFNNHIRSTSLFATLITDCLIAPTRCIINASLLIDDFYLLINACSLHRQSVCALICCCCFFSSSSSLSVVNQ
ncbi:hypothetical protein L6452_06935 [Arctium lappa]|uniref:Uncharacterized protein n=1 Tax=Arctium lappa TaxID=4217 RepID=A0ACB9EKC1_ARCLA|nr:hypothetical protein L6452_06935 [Arctium lappa]